MIRTAIAMLAAGLAAAPAASQSIIHDVAGSTPTTFFNPVNLGAGTYAMRFIGTADGGAFDAFNAWNFGDDVIGCNSNGSGCGRGWLNAIVIDWAPIVDAESDDLTYINSAHPDGQVFASPELALAAMRGPFGFQAASTKGRPAGNFVGAYMFTLAQAQQIKVRVGDNAPGDNAGGVSLLFTPVPTPPGGVPEPASWALLIAGFGLTGVALRRRRALTA